jgi:hypothetical protein
LDLAAPLESWGRKEFIIKGRITIIGRRNMSPSVQDEIEKKIQALSEIYNVSVSIQAQSILGECIEAITVDPHPSWPSSRGDRQHQQFQDDMLNALPSALANLAVGMKLKKITSFDLLHNMSALVDGMCPFLKPPP